jgi:hypothetical protein
MKHLGVVLRQFGGYETAIAAMGVFLVTKYQQPSGTRDALQYTKSPPV